MADYTRQYRPITTAENQGDDALTVRVPNEAAWSINNYKAHFGAVLIPANIYPNGIGFISDENDDNENVVHVYGGRFVGAGLNFVWWELSGAMIGGASGNCTWKLYSSTERYTGPKIFDSDYLGDRFHSGSIQFTTTTHAEPAGVKFGMAANADGLTYLTLTATNSIAAGGEASRLTGISAQAALETASIL